jgi:biopolymer transport protein ExbD
MTSSEARSGRKEDEPRMDMTPMIDVTFQLLIFFMCTIRFKTLEGKLAAYLPKDVGRQSAPVEPQEKVDIVLRVVEQGTRLHPHLDRPWSGRGAYRHGDDRVLELRIGPRVVADRAALRARLGELYRADPARGATIDARPGIVYAEVVGALDQAIDAGFTDVTFKGARSEQAR